MAIYSEGCVFGELPAAGAIYVNECKFLEPVSATGAVRETFEDYDYDTNLVGQGDWVQLGANTSGDVARETAPSYCYEEDQCAVFSDGDGNGAKLASLDIEGDFSISVFAHQNLWAGPYAESWPIQAGFSSGEVLIIGHREPVSDSYYVINRRSGYEVTTTALRDREWVEHELIREGDTLTFKIDNEVVMTWVDATLGTLEEYRVYADDGDTLRIDLLTINEGGASAIYVMGNRYG